MSTPTTTDVTFTPLPDGSPGWRLKETETHYIDVIPMIYNWRIVWSHKESYLYGWERAWCYASLTAAVSAAAVWDGAEHTEPTGWHKDPTTGRVRPDGDPSKEYVNR